MRINPEAAPEAYRELKARWFALVSETPADPQIVRGAADFIAIESLDEARQLLRAAIERAPTDAQLWLDLGRMSEDPHERRSAFERAREAGENLPNLLVWIATTSIKAGEHRKAEKAAGELMQMVDDARAKFGAKLDLAEGGRALWKRAREICPSDEAANELTDAIAQHAYREHWGHTVLGLLACHEGNLDGAVVHLHASANVRLAIYCANFALVVDGMTGSSTSAPGSGCGMTHVCTSGSLQ